MVEEAECQRQLIVLDRDFLALKEKECMLRAQLRECTTQQGVLGLRACNAQLEMEVVERRIQDLQDERRKIYGMLYAVREAKESKRRGDHGRRTSGKPEAKGRASRAPKDV